MKTAAFREYQQGHTTFIHRPAALDTIKKIPSRGPFGEPSHLNGRGTIYIFEKNFIVRHLTHGGALRWLTGDRFLGWGRTRRELEINHLLIANRILTPEIIGARLIRKGCFRRIDVISRRIHDSIDLLTWFEQPRDEGRTILNKTGKLIRQVHDLGIWHADLHIKNILLDDQLDPWILDLDKARHYKTLSRRQRARNLERFYRSCRKWENRDRIHLPPDWQAIIEAGYNSGDQ